MAEAIMAVLREGLSLSQVISSIHFFFPIVVRGCVWVHCAYNCSSVQHLLNLTSYRGTIDFSTCHQGRREI